MLDITRRNIFKACLAGAAASPLTFIGGTQAEHLAHQLLLHCVHNGRAVLKASAKPI